MSSNVMAEKYRDVMRAQQEETDLLEAMKDLNKVRGTVFKDLAQAHYDEIKQLKRTQSYELSKLKTQHRRDLEVASAATTKTHMDDLKSKDDKIRRLESMLAEANEQVDKARFLDMQLHGAVAQIGREDSLKERLKQTKSHADSLSVEIQHKDKELLALQREMMDAPISKERTLSVVTLLNSEIGAHMKAIRSREESDDVVKNHEQERLKQQRQFYQTQRKNLQDRLSRLNAKSVVLSSPFDPMYVINTLKAQRKSTIAHMETLLQWLDETKEGLVREKTWFLGEWETAGNVNEASHLERIKKLFELSDHCGILESLRRNQDKAKVYSNAGGEMKMHVGD